MNSISGAFGHLEFNQSKSIERNNLSLNFKKHAPTNQNFDDIIRHAFKLDITESPADQQNRLKAAIQSIYETSRVEIAGYDSNMSDAELIEWISQHLNDKLHNTEDCFTPEELTLVINLYSLLKASKRMDSELFTDFEKKQRAKFDNGQYIGQVREVNEKTKYSLDGIFQRNNVC